MSNNLTTKCNKCANYIDQQCSLGYPTVKDENFGIVTQGFCKFNTVIGSEGPADIKLSVIITGNNIKAIQANLINLSNINNGIIYEIIICINDTNDKQINKLFNALTESKFKWKVLSDLDGLPLLESMNDAVEKADGNWFLSIKDKTLISSRQLELISANIKSKNFYNLLCMYFDKSEPLEIVSNKSAFMESGGNRDASWLNYICSFDNNSIYVIKVD